MRYEAAAWVLAKGLGWTDLVATTVLRETDAFPDVDEEVTTSLQVLWPGFELDANLDQFPDEDIWRAALFDVLIFHTDRTHNWGAVPGHGQKRLKLIDHGYAFREWAGREFASSFANAKAGRRFPMTSLRRSTTIWGPPTTPYEKGSANTYWRNSSPAAEHSSRTTVSTILSALLSLAPDARGGRR